MASFKPTTTFVMPTHPQTHRASEQKLVVNRYMFPSAGYRKPKIAVLFMHAIGFTKEMWHPIMQRLLENFRDNSFDLEFVAYDMRNHGDSAIVNESVLDQHMDATDNALDALHVIDTCNLKRDAIALVGVALSYGGTSLVMAETIRPGTFNTMIPMDPILYPNFINPDFSPMADPSRKRRNHWECREAALHTFLSSRFCKNWDPEMMTIYIRDGLRRVPGTQSEVVLKCEPEQEYQTFMFDKHTFYNAYTGLAFMSTPVHFIFGQRSPVISREVGALMVSQHSSATGTIIPGAGHLIPMEKPDDVVRELLRAIQVDVIAQTRQFARAML
ncbi:Alpha/Beta hydrolase protein [Jimgerdemannia flammicorona]|uniref:Alpha/Beta hydrolase protein n=1 Tax=Jimgerdemannia flammicorona TaxID=994334 RepID=A0A432ZZV4_9FUNG|nr:Alpha/Beta hydrolase protein [Jimgerdemannia flammicorona]